jgi:carboxylesterase
MIPRHQETLSRWHETERVLAVPEEHRSFARDGEANGPRVVLLHGGSGSPADLVGLADDLAEQGATVLCPLLPCHGRGDAALGGIVFGELVERAFEAHDAMADGGAPVILVGQSMGAALGIRVAAERDVLGFVALAPALRPYVLRRLLGLVPLALAHPFAARTLVRWQSAVRRGMRDAARVLPEVRCPLLILHSDDDDSVDIRGAHEMLTRAASRQKRLEILHGQGHVLSLAPDRHREVFPRVRTFVASIAPATRTRRSNPRP